MDGGYMGMAQMKDSRIELCDGRLFNPMDPDPSLMSIEVISNALALCTRFAGQSRSFYSIAQHSVLVAVLTDQDHAAQRCALLHDADECFGLPDLPTPIKPLFPDYVAAQKRIGAAVDARYRINPELHARIKPADRQALLIEKRRLKDLRNAGYWSTWSAGVSVPDWISIDPLGPEQSLSLIRSAFRRVFRDKLPIDRDWLRGRPGFILS